jgi:hypothetical protein
MKTITNFIIGFCITLVALAFGYKAFNQVKTSVFEKHTTASISIFSDVTDPKFTQPDINEILEMQGFSDVKHPEMWNGITIRATVLSDVDLNRVKTALLKPQNPWLSNEFERAKEISRFREESENLMQGLQDENGKNQSSIIKPIYEETLRLINDSSNEKVLIVYSDLIQNTSELTLYSPAELEAFAKKNDSVNYLEQEYPLPTSIKGLIVYLIYSPVDAIDNERYIKISDVFKEYFERNGAQVIRRANLIR